MTTDLGCRRARARGSPDAPYLARCTRRRRSGASGDDYGPTRPRLRRGPPTRDAGLTLGAAGRAATRRRRPHPRRQPRRLHRRAAPRRRHRPDRRCRRSCRSSEAVLVCRQQPVRQCQLSTAAVARSAMPSAARDRSVGRRHFGLPVGSHPKRWKRASPTWCRRSTRTSTCSRSRPATLAKGPLLFIGTFTAVNMDGTQQAGCATGYRVCLALVDLRIGQDRLEGFRRAAMDGVDMRRPRSSSTAPAWAPDPAVTRATSHLPGHERATRSTRRTTTASWRRR